MRDIYFELVERLKELDADAAATRAKYDQERTALESAFIKRMTELQEIRQSYVRVMDNEEKIAREDGAPATRTKPMELMPLGEFFLGTLAKRGPLTKTELRQAACEAGYFESDAGGRTTHTTIMNFCASHKIVRMDDGRYGLPPAPETLFGLGSNTEGRMNNLN